MTTVPFDAFLARASENPLGLAQLALIFFNMGDKTRARQLALQALAAAPSDPEISSLTSSVLSDGIPRWHFNLVRDEPRNAAYEAALQRAVTAQTTVLEIGTGTGILAMMAARAGARHVVTCEMIPAIAATAQEIVARNGFADRVRVVAKKSYDVDAETDMGGRADLLVSELIENTMLGEGTLPVLEHAVDALLKPGAKIIPSRGIIRVALAHDADIGRKRMDTIDGFDLSPFNRLARAAYRIRRGDTRLTLLSTPADLLAFDFQSGGPFPSGTALTTVVSTGGEANGIAQWIALKMDEEGWYENNPLPGASSSWAVMFWPLIARRDCPAGSAVSIWGSHDRRRVRIWA